MQRGIDYIGVGVGALILNDEGKLLICQRGPLAKNERGKWEIPGGAVEFGETFEEGLVREMQEELGVKIKVLSLLDVCSHIIPDEHQHWVSPTYFCRVLEGEVANMEPGKCDQFGWFTLDEAEQLDLSLVTQHDIRALRRKFPHGQLTLAE